MFKLTNAIFNIIMIVENIAEIFAIPTILIIVGVLNSFTWKYYVISLSVYFVLFAVLYVIARLIFNKLDKKFSPHIFKMIESFFEGLSRK